MEKTRQQAYLDAMGIQQWVHRATEQALLDVLQAEAQANGPLTSPGLNSAESVSDAPVALNPNQAQNRETTGAPEQGRLASVLASVTNAATATTTTATTTTTTAATATATTTTPAPISATASAASTTTPITAQPTTAPGIDGTSADRVNENPVVAKGGDPDNANSDKAPSEDADSKPATVVPAAPFSALYGQFGQGILVVVELEDLYAPGFSAQEHQLFHNILTALGWQPTSMQSLKWPMDSQLLANDQASMEIMLSSFLGAQVQRAGVTRLIVFGAQLSTNFERYFKEHAGPNAISKLGLPSLGALLRKPEQKAKVWNSLKPLRR